MGVGHLLEEAVEEEVHLQGEVVEEEDLFHLGLVGEEVVVGLLLT